MCNFSPLPSFSTRPCRQKEEEEARKPFLSTSFFPLSRGAKREQNEDKRETSSPRKGKGEEKSRDFFTSPLSLNISFCSVVHRAQHTKTGKGHYNISKGSLKIKNLKVRKAVKKNNKRYPFNLHVPFFPSKRKKVTVLRREGRKGIGHSLKKEVSGDDEVGRKTALSAFKTPSRSFFPPPTVKRGGGGGLSVAVEE